jgi:NitT/TauT family transport system ATP-binding protein
MSLASLNLPDYREQSPEVAERFRGIRQRPVVLRVSDLGKSFDGHGTSHVAFENFSLDIHRRELICIIGPSGCGKSTLIRIIAGLDEQTSGHMLVDGKEVGGPGPERGMVFQGYTLFPWLTVKGNVMFGLQMGGMSAIEAEAKALQWLGLVGLGNFAEAYPSQLSGGMKQRVAIARALAPNPRVLLMDEPFGALDALTRCKMQSYLLQIWKKINVTILFITHDLEEACYLADRIIVMSANPGRIAEVIENPVPRPRHVAQMLSPEFLALKQRLDELIHGPADAEEEKLPVVKLTEEGDEVE